MREYHVPAVSLAIIDHGKIVYSHAYSINKKLTVMTNSENGIPVIKGTIQAIAQLHKWPKHSPLIDESQRMPIRAT